MPKSSTGTIAATATFRDTYAGVVAAILVPFKTKRKGQTVTRYRWQEEVRGFAAGGWASPFVSTDQAIACAKRHALFSNVQAVETALAA
ncbi:hypothetical protein [Rhizobium alvei]|uniref:Uncharacterized protein n=1 Tax=Rhizobium alvei TaxID=1132659 RepID=A0ABT8YK16_9HYPH|nr:hypothetical protein [Rhizobium alvei]MDO6963995.1 hypothetical protein [Rhizobium alvei]